MNDADLQPRRVEWPTVALAAGAVVLFAAAVVLVVQRVIHPAAAGVMATLACFIAFTPLHEAAHYNVARARWLNELVGHVCAVLLTGTLGPYRYLHGEHHRHTNEPHDDPDHWSGRGPAWLLPLRFATQDVAYLAFYLRRWRTRPVRERMDLVVSALAYSAVAGAAVWAGREALTLVLVVWIIPARLALMALAWTFDWLPHRPHVITAAADRHRATTLHSSPLLHLLLIGQSYHLVHHLFPRVPFTRYARLWRARRAELTAMGAHDRALPRPDDPEAG